MALFNSSWQAEVTWTASGGDQRSVRGEVLRVGPRMVKMVVAEEPPLNQPCTVALFRGETRFATPAVVYFLRMARGGKLVSCRFDAPLSAEVLEHLRQAGLYERREKERQAIALDAPAWPELNASAEPVPVRIVDLSRGGCCVKSPVAVPVGHRLTVFAGDQNGPGDVVRLRIHWQQDTGDAWLLGCAFVRDSDYATLAALAPQQAATARAGRWVQSVLGLAPTAPLSAVPSTPG